MVPNALQRAGRLRFACLLVPLCALFLLILLVIGIGFLLPAEYEGAHDLTLERPPEEVWEAVSDFRRYPIAGRNTRSVEELSGEPGLPVWREDLGQVSLRIRTLRATAPRHLEREIRGIGSPLEARFTLELIPVAGGTKVSARQRVQVEGYDLAVPFARLVHYFGGAERWTRDYLEFLEQGLRG